MLMESTPSMTNWQERSKLKRPGMHMLASLQAIAHGSDTVQYFQWRKSRGSSEKFHGAVVDHCGHEHNRVFRDVAELGKVLSQLDDVVGTSVQPDVALIYDWENRWAIDDAQGLNNKNKDYVTTCEKHYKTFWENGVPVDVINMDQDFSSYKVLVAPMLYMVREGVGQRIDAFVKNGGTFVATYCSGVVNESDLCFLGGFPGPLREALGIWAEETDSLYDDDQNFVKMLEGSNLPTDRTYKVKHICDIIHCETAKALAEYGNDFYAGSPALTVNHYGEGKAYYMAFRNNDDFEKDFYNQLIKEHDLLRALNVELPEGVTAQMRTDGERDFVFVMNFSEEAREVALEEGIIYHDLLDGKQIEPVLQLGGYGVKIIVRKHG